MSCHSEMLVYYLVIIYKNQNNRIGGVMVSVLAKLVFVASPLSTQH